MIYVKDIINICDGKLICGDINLECNNFVIDSRNVCDGDVFIGVKGETFDGNLFYKDAIKNGASICILDSATKVDGDNIAATIVLVNDTVKCLQELAKYKRSLVNIPVVAVTGSVGKTSVKDIIYAVLSSKYKVLSTIGNFNNHIGLPLTILRFKDEDMMVLEMGMSEFGEIELLSNIAKPTIGVITNIGTAHIGNLGSRENILKAKLEILSGMDNGYLVINNDNDMLRTVKYDNLITVGIDNKSDYMATNVMEDVFSSSFLVNNRQVELSIGSHAFIYNALFAFAVCEKLGMKFKEINSAINNFKLSPHRLEVIKTKDLTIIDDTYNASFDSVKNSLELLGKTNRRKVFIFADILELDSFGESIHKDIGNVVIDNNIQLLITVGNLSKYTYEVVKNNNIESYHYNTNNEVICNIFSIIKPEDIILIKGSHGMKLIEVVEYLKNNNK